MKKSLLISVLAAIAVCMPLAASAAFFGYELELPDTNYAESKTKVYSLGALGTYDLWYTGSATLSPSSASATLTGLNSGKIWSYEYSENGSTWVPLDKLIATFSATANSNGTSYSESKTTTIHAQYIRLGYNWKLDSLANTSTSGSASFTATPVVPEPSSILALGAMLSGTGMILRRRKG